jgi:uncharacterized protein (TIGR02271 family)
VITKYYIPYLIYNYMSNSKNIDWNDVIKKEARGSDDEDLGEVQETGQDYVLVQKGMISKEKFYIPKNMVESYDGSVLRFNISKEEVKNRYMRDSPPTPADSSQETDTRVPLVEERLNVSKQESAQEATITKEPVTETKTVEVPVTHEEMTIERRPASGTAAASERPVESKTEMKIPLKKEEVQVTKEPYVKEEVSVKKKPVTETRQVSEQLRSEKVSARGKTIEEEEIEDQEKE